MGDLLLLVQLVFTFPKLFLSNYWVNFTTNLTKVIVAETEQNKPNQTEKSESGQSQNKYHKSGRRYYPKKRYYKPQGSDQQASAPRLSFQKISLVIPLLNEEESILPLINEIRKALKPINKPYEIIFIDDGSKDRSGAILREFAHKDERVRIIFFQKNFGSFWNQKE